MLESERRERLSYGDDPKRNYPLLSYHIGSFNYRRNLGSP